MQEVLELTYDRTYYWIGKQIFLCSQAVQTQAPHIRLTCSNVPIDSPNVVTVFLYKIGRQGWQWINNGKLIPLILHKRGTQTINRLFPNASSGETHQAWLLIEEI